MPRPRVQIGTGGGRWHALLGAASLIFGEWVLKLHRKRGERGNIFSKYLSASWLFNPL